MDLIGAIIAGLSGAAAMALFLYIGPLVGMPRIDLIHLSGSIFSGVEKTASVLGTVLHLMMGTVFGILYGFLWSLGIVTPSWRSGLLLGLVHGILAGSMMPSVLMKHPRNPTLERSTVWVAAFYLAHLVFGIVTALVYAPFA